MGSSVEWMMVLPFGMAMPKIGFGERAADTEITSASARKFRHCAAAPEAPSRATAGGSPETTTCAKARGDGAREPLRQKASTAAMLSHSARPGRQIDHRRFAAVSRAAAS